MGGLSGFEVSPAELERFAGSARARAADVAAEQTSIERAWTEQAHPSASAFGRLAGPGERFGVALDGHCLALAAGLATAAEAMTSIADGVRAAAAGYRAADATAAASLAALCARLDETVSGGTG